MNALHASWLTVDYFAARSNSEAENEKPIFLSGLRDTTVDESSVLSMSAPFRGNPIPDVQWFKDGTLLLPNERIHFTCDGYKVRRAAHKPVVRKRFEVINEL